MREKVRPYCCQRRRHRLSTHLVHENLTQLVKLLQFGPWGCVDDGADGITDARVGRFPTIHVSLGVCNTHLSWSSSPNLA